METNFQLLMLSSNMLKSKNPMLRVCRLVETNFQLLMLSPNLLKSQIPMSSGGGGGLVETNFQLLILSPNLLKSFAENFLSFRAKKCLGMVLDFEYQVAHVYKVYANHNNLNVNHNAVLV